MGAAKHRMMELQERGYSPPETYVCPACITDPHLSKRVADEIDEDEQCSYCDAESAAPVEVLLEAISDTVIFDYTDPAEELPYETAEGGYQGDVLDSYDVLESLSEWTNEDRLREDVFEAFTGSFWCRRHYFSATKYEVLRFGWEAFVEQIKHRTRYLFLDEVTDDPYDPESIPPGRMLQELGSLLSHLASFRTIDPTVPIFRARIHSSNDSFTTADDLGAPSNGEARFSNRMSPAGIAMFYGAFDTDTAIAETVDPARTAGKVITVGTFIASRPLQLLDLTSLPSVPSDFDEESRELRDPIRFLLGFAADLKKPIQRDGCEHVEYVPTQVVSEHVRHRMRNPTGAAIDGIQYSSSRQHGKVAVVIFADKRLCGPRQKPDHWDPDPLLLLQDVHREDPAVFSHLWQPVSPGSADESPSNPATPQLSLFDANHQAP